MADKSFFRVRVKESCPYPAVMVKDLGKVTKTWQLKKGNASDYAAYSNLEVQSMIKEGNIFVPAPDAAPTDENESSGTGGSSSNSPAPASQNDETVTMERVVWASTDMMFRKRQEQLAARKVDHNPKDNLGILDMPFCSFRLTQDGVNWGTDRTWWNAPLSVKGIWTEELGRRIRLTPMTLAYEACFICQHDTDLYWAQNANVWDKSGETIIESFVDAVGPLMEYLIH